MRNGVDPEQAYWDVQRLDWLEIDTPKGPRPAFAGRLGGAGRLIVGDSREQLIGMAYKMALGHA